MLQDIAREYRERRLRLGFVSNKQAPVKDAPRPGDKSEIATGDLVRISEIEARIAVLEDVLRYIGLMSEEKINKARSVAIEDIKRKVCEFYAIDMKDLVSVRRPAGIVRPRQIAMYLAKEVAGQTYSEIARRFGRSDHTRVIHAHRKIAHLITVDAEIDREVRELTALLLMEAA